ncbi:MAG: NUDIX domain-containing protein [Flavobacteriales bacterium]|nr:NUDIX domain-containing protein [Flavobacteriales bacterium]MCB9167552.1 NUDIX domain-containing protein [Flavobacteriales bacterium]
MKRFTIRVYGLLVHEGCVLVADERIRGRCITKFPGGGLEFGEGTKDCLVREVREEIGVVAKDLVHFYTTDYFQRSAFHETEVQVLSIYYNFSVERPEGIAASMGDEPAYPELEGGELFRWLRLGDVRSDAVTLPIDRRVLGMLIEREVR